MGMDVKHPTGLFDIAGRTAIVIGAAGAFGSLAARTLAGAGANLVLADGQDEALRGVVAECEALGARVVPLARPLDGEATCAAIVHAAVERFGGLDILVVASGMNDVAAIVDMAPERFARVMDVNVTQTWLIARAAGARMIAQGRGGKVVLTSSARGKLGHPAGYSAYCASKAAVEGITRALGCEWGKYGITVNAIAPILFRSPLTEWMFGEDERARTVRAQFLARIPLGRLGEPEDLAGPLLFLVSRASDFYTGHTLDADGGYSAG